MNQWVSGADSYPYCPAEAVLGVSTSTAEVIGLDMSKLLDPPEWRHYPLSARAWPLQLTNTDALESYYVYVFPYIIGEQQVVDIMLIHGFEDLIPGHYVGDRNQNKTMIVPCYELPSLELMDIVLTNTKSKESAGSGRLE